MVPGLDGKSEMVVKGEDLVKQSEDSAIQVLSTPRLIELLEAAALEAIREFIPQDQLSLGTEVRIKHLSAFWVDAYDEKGKVAEGEHERVLISKEKFQQKVEKKRMG